MTISLKSIHLKYGERLVLCELNYQFNKGVYLISGESGSGKTTLLNLIKGYVQPDKGEIERGNSTISYMMQETMLFSNLTVSENFMMKYALHHALEDEKYKSILSNDMTNIGLPINLLNTKVSSLSGGQKRKLELLLISCDPSEIILLDEPVANLDKASIQQIVAYVESHWSDERTVIISSHSEMNFEGPVNRLLLDQGTLRSI
ncbi:MULTISPECIES: ATP-binding cassette domain-containing protein [unclassified Paenibacillus]|uniref:ABC transporter ATP-binding protein n=1 Tax=unclassified Paenibacillus TaxID=185978 RepID=UPI0007BF6B5D|nr:MULTISPECIES: ATP-binding cassette domain-containing protein [unclassified Paenibacillus]SEB26026.1 putative ABC transport system ATP-binding protein [Paenibacillus sp. 276b]